jgi:peptide chain release factor 2
MLESEMGRPDFWNAPDLAHSMIKKMKGIKRVLEPFIRLQKELRDHRELIQLCDQQDSQLLSESEVALGRLEYELNRFELATMFTGRNDAKPVFMSIHAGAGGTDSCDWAEMLFRMYTRWLYRNGYRFQIVDSLPGDEAGLRRVTLSIEGEYPFGYLKSEIGVHRLVRISPFDASKRRHTSFASVDIIPEPEEIEIQLQDKELRIDTFRSSGKGGQHLNVTDSAVRITHIPTGITAQCQNERSQYLNKKTAMKILVAKLYQLEERKQQEELAAMYGEKGEIAWGNQIRSYILQPYTLVKDHRTGYETGKVQDVLDGELDGLIEAFLRWKGRKY